jgi:ASC-1-like (ASCH) protein
MIVSSIKNNEIIEVRGYDSGYGCLHRIKLNELLADVSNYDELLDRYYKNKTITLKDKQGKLQKKYAFTLLKLID